jgi:glycosyltransferase involved in cell wall biosynthesis
MSQTHSTTPLVSVIMPAFNAERYIAEALTSIQNQTLRSVEVIVIDDGSTDGTVREAERFAGALDLTVMRQTNAGPSAARNAGIRRARGRYCAFLDADDVMVPELLEAQSSLLEADPEVGLVLTDVMTFDDKGIVHGARWKLADPFNGTMLDRLLIENYVTTSAVMAPVHCLREAGLFPEDRRVAEDYELWLRLAARWKIAFIDRPLVRYRYTSGSLSWDKLFSARSALEVIEKFWEAHPDYLASHRDVHHRSMARHLMNAGAAAASQGQRGVALGYLTRSLRHDVRTLPTWKWVVKTLILPADSLAGRVRPRQTAAAPGTH